MLRSRIQKAKSSGYGYVASQQVPTMKQKGHRVVKERNAVLHNHNQRVQGDEHKKMSSPRRRGQAKHSEAGRGSVNRRELRKKEGSDGGKHWRGHPEHHRPSANDQYEDGGDGWHEVPIELNSLVIPSPSPRQHDHDDLTQEQRDLLAEYEHHENSNSGLYAPDVPNNGGGSIVSIGINEDGSVTVLPPKDDSMKQDPVPGRQLSGSHAQSSNSSGGIHGDDTPDGAQTSLLYYDIPAVDMIQNKVFRTHRRNL